MRTWTNSLPIVLAATACSNSGSGSFLGSVDCAELMPELYDGIMFTRSSGSSTLSVNEHCPAFVVGSDEQQQVLQSAWRNSNYETDVRPLDVKMRGYLVVSEAERENITFRIVEILSVSPQVSAEEVRQKSAERFGSSPIATFTTGRKEN